MESSNVSLLSYWLENGHMLYQLGFYTLMLPSYWLIDRQQ